MVIGIVARDYAFFTFMVDDINSTIENVCDSLYMEAKLANMGFVINTKGDSWDF